MIRVRAVVQLRDAIFEGTAGYVYPHVHWSKGRIQYSLQYSYLTALHGRRWWCTEATNNMVFQHALLPPLDSGQQEWMGHTFGVPHSF